jgi:hypothetical protein
VKYTTIFLKGKSAMPNRFDDSVDV